MMKKKFIRTDMKRYSKLGKNRKKLQKWRKASGRDNKIREKRFGYPKSPAVGYKRPKKYFGQILGKTPINVYNLKDLNNVKKENVVIIGKVGARKKLEIIKKANELKLKIGNIVGEKL